MLAAILLVGGLGGAAFHPPAAALAHRLGGERRGLAMSVYITGGTLGFSLGPLLFAPFAERFGLAVDAAAGDPGSGRRGVLPAPGAAGPAAPVGARRLRGASSLREAARAALRDRRPAHADVARLRHVRPGDADAARVHRSAQAGAAVALYLFGSGVGGFFGGPAADRFGARRVIALVARRVLPVPVRGAVAHRLARSCSCSRSAACSCSRRCRSTSRSASRWRR